MTWKNASERCTLVGSKKTPSYAFRVKDIPLSKDTIGYPHWVGATASFTPWFELLGNRRYLALKKTKYICKGHLKHNEK